MFHGAVMDGQQGKTQMDISITTTLLCLNPYPFVFCCSQSS